MTFDPVPWFVGGGAQHSPEVARLLAYAATGGAEGIIASGDLKVAPLSPAGTAIRVLSGAALILNKAAGGTQQTYVGRNPSEDVKGIAATGSGSGRSDLIIAQVKDPFMPGEPWNTPADVTVGPYIFTTVISNVAPGTTTVPAGTSGIPLARIDIPSNTATITAGMIKDLREVANPRRKPYLFHTVPTGPQQLVSSPWNPWASMANQTVVVPTWATRAHIRVEMGGVMTYAGDTWGRVRAQLGPSVLTRDVAYDKNTPAINNVDRITLLWGDSVDVSAIRGQSVTFAIYGKKDGGNTAIEVNTLSSIVTSVEFIESAI